MQSNKAVDSTSSKNSVTDKCKFQSFPISLYNVDNKDKSLPLLLSIASKVFQSKETGVQVSTDNGQKNKLLLPNLHQICLRTFSLNSFFNALPMQRCMK